MAYELNSATLAEIATAGVEFQNGKWAALESVCRLAIAVRNARIESLAIPAAQRPKLEMIKEAMRIAFGGNSKESDRASYDQCSLAFRLCSRAEKVAESAFGEFAARNDAKGFAKDLTLWAGDNSIVAIKAWIIGEKPKAVQKTLFERLESVVNSKGAELSRAEIETLAGMFAGLLSAKVSAETAMADALKDAA